MKNTFNKNMVKRYEIGDLVQYIRNNKIYEIYKLDLNEDKSISWLAATALDKDFKSLGFYIAYMDSDYKNLISDLKYLKDFKLN